MNLEQTILGDNAKRTNGRKRSTHARNKTVGIVISAECTQLQVNSACLRISG
jgi:hypothetical protein